MKIFFSLIVCIFLATGCSEQKKAKNYDNLRDQLVFDVFTQLKTNNHQAALAAFDKLSRKFNDNQFATLFVALEKKNLYLKKAQSALTKDMLSETIVLLEKAHQDEQTKIIKEFIHIRTYLSKRPFKTSAAAFESYDHLVRLTPTVSENKVFNAFLKKEENVAKALKEKEYQALLLDIVKTYDKLLLSNDNFSYMIAQKFPRKLPKKPRYISTKTEALKALKQRDTKFNLITTKSFVDKLKTYPLQSLGKLDQVVQIFHKNKNKQGLALMGLLESQFKISRTLKKAVFHQSPMLTGIMRKMNDSEISSATVLAAMKKKFEADRLKTLLKKKRLLKEAKLKKAKAEAEAKTLKEASEVESKGEVEEVDAEDIEVIEIDEDDLFKVPNVEN